MRTLSAGIWSLNRGPEKTGAERCALRVDERLAVVSCAADSTMTSQSGSDSSNKRP